MYLSELKNLKIINFILKQVRTGGRPVSSFCTDRSDFEMLKVYRTQTDRHKHRQLQRYRGGEREMGGGDVLKEREENLERNIRYIKN